MPNFKPKAKKKIKMNESSILTLDNQHSDKMNEFKQIELIVIPNLKKERKELKKKLKLIHDIEEQLNIKDKLKEIKKEIKNLEEKKKNIY